jgi:S1-C subfamily serine protease
VIVALPLVGAPVAAPAVAAITTVDARAYGANALFPDQDAAGFAAKQRASRATARQTKGVVLIDTVLDYDLGRAAGTGLVIGRDGIVVTNHHVVQDATSITVRVPGGTKYVANVVGYDADDDIAVLRLTDATHLRTVATRSTVHVGDAVEAVGNAAGLDRLTAADGRVLKRGVSIRVEGDLGGHEHLSGLIKNSADVVPGDSGGALLDNHDRVVGMSVAASADPHDVVGFAIPIAQVKRVAARIVSGRPSPKIVLGPRAALGVEIDPSGKPGLIARVVKGGPAEKAGLKAGDVITSIGSTPITSDSQVPALMATMAVGQQVAVGYTDTAGVPQTATLTLWAGPIG